MNRAVFLDRDGVITREPPYYAYKISQLKIIKNVAKSINLLNQAGFKIVIITNQSGIARGIYKENDTTLFHQELLKRLRRKSAIVDKIYFCPHHPNGILPKYKKNCRCRKPKAGMIFQAAKELDISLTDSFLIGDKISDIDAGIKAKCQTILVKTGQGKEQFKKAPHSQFKIFKSLHHAVTSYILTK